MHSPTTLQYTKMHGLGNDYVYFDCFLQHTPSDPGALSRLLSPRQKGLGGDGIILILPCAGADAMMRIYNADGSEAQMCGNGIRCVGKYLADHHRALRGRPQLKIDTLAGIKTLTLHRGRPDGLVETVTVDMGAPVLEPDKIPVRAASCRDIRPEGADTTLTAVSMGNPHGVVFVDGELTDALVHTLGPRLENHPVWPERANIEFVRVIDAQTLQMRVWERGSGETMACGTGACATAVAAHLTGRAGGSLTVRLLGGDLDIEIRQRDGHVLMTGPATEVATGTVTFLDDFSQLLPTLKPVKLITEYVQD